MSDEESFVILGSTPTPSMEAYSSLESQPNQPTSNHTQSKSIQSNYDTLEHISQTSGSFLNASSPDASMASVRSCGAIVTNQSPMRINSLKGDSLNSHKGNIKAAFENSISDSSVTSTTPKTSGKFEILNNKFAREHCKEETLAHKYLLGKMGGDTLMHYVSHEFPSLCSKDSRQDDMDKLKQLVIDSEISKNQLQKTNIRLGELVDLTQILISKNENQQFKYEQDVDNLRQENTKLRQELEDRLQAVQLNEEIMKQDHLDLIKKVSEGNSIINNMSVQMEKLELQHNDISILNIHELGTRTGTHQSNSLTDESASHLTRKVKQLERELSQTKAESLQIQDMKTNYIDEITCLKVNLTSAEELLKQQSAEIDILKCNDLENNKLIQQNANEINALKHQLEIYRNDFEIERNSRQELAGQKDQLLTDLKLLQRRNQQLLEETERSRAQMNTPIITAPSTSGSTAQPQVFPTNSYICPICNKIFQALAPLQFHAATCSS